MKKHVIPIVIAAAAVLILGVFLFAPKASDYSPGKALKQSDTTATELSSSSPAEPSPGSYIKYSTSAIADTVGTKILFFHAPWCPQCKALEASIVKGPIPAGTTIIKVDYDSSQALRQQYGVTTQTTLVLVDDNGKLVKKYVAYSTPSLDSLIANLL